MRRIFFLYVAALFVISGCAANPATVKSEESFLPGAEPPAEDEWRGKKAIPSEVQDEIIKRISGLPEYKEVQQNIDRISNHRKGVTSIIDLDDYSRGYTVQVGYSVDDRFAAYYIFLVLTGSYEILIRDMADDKYIPLDVWRKKNADR